MTDAELADSLRELEEARRRVHDGLHEAKNVLAAWKGEMDLVNLSARKVVDGLQHAVDEFYVKFPEFRMP